ncbi:MAG: cell division protein FtsA [Bacteroidetes bacterium]|nr:cell division protein FtsA [Bacteroidota bacterium]
MRKVKTDKIIVGLDIGTTKVCAIVGKMNENGKINVMGIGKSPSMGGVSRGMVSNIGKTVEAIKAAVAIASKQSNIDIARVYVGIAGHHIHSKQYPRVRTRTNHQEEITREELREMEKEMHSLYLGNDLEIIHILPQEYKVDGEPDIIDPVGMTGLKLEGSFHVITGQTTAAKNITQAVEKAGLEVDGLFVEPVASARAVLSQEEMEGGVALVDIGGGTSDIAIFHNGIIRHTAVIPYGGDIITNDIREAFQLGKEQAEALKVKCGSAIPEESRRNQIQSIQDYPGRKAKEISLYNLSLVINARACEIINLIYDQIRMSGYANKLAAGIVLTGGGANLQYLNVLMEGITGLDTQMGIPNQHLGMGMVDEVKSPMYATAVGLVLNGYDASLDHPEPEPAPSDGKKERSPKPPWKKFFNLFIDDNNLDDFK